MDSSTQVLIHALQDKDAKLRSRAAFDLANVRPMPRSALPALKEAQSDASREVRLNAAIAIGRIEPAAADPRTIQLLIEALQAPELWFREGAACSMAGMGTRVQTAVPQLIAALHSVAPDPKKDRDGAEATMRLIGFACAVLGGLGASAARAVPDLARIVSGAKQPFASPHCGNIRAAAAQALGQLGRIASHALPVLENALKDEESEVRLAAAKAITSIRSK